jgi:NACHT domain
VDSPHDRSIFWLSGTAGTGKSTIARTVAREYYEKKKLGASFFFSRGEWDLGHAGKFFTTIATQLAGQSLDLKRYICEAIAKHTDIVDQSLYEQGRRLILHPLSRVRAGSLSSPLVLVIDALDECEVDHDIRIILRVLAEVKTLRTIQMRVLITSRPESMISHAFYTISGAGYRYFILDNVSLCIVNHDISTFFRYELGIVRKIYDLPKQWPSEQAIQLLVKKAGGFLWAATACRFINDGKRFAERRLSLILEGDTTLISSESKLDKIYTTILAHSVGGEYNEGKQGQCERFRETVGSIIILFDSLPAVTLTTLLNKSKKEIDQSLDGLGSILQVSDSRNYPIRVLHFSFRDFLIDKQRCTDQRFWVDEKKAHEALAENCLRLMFNTLGRDICGLNAPGLRYACRYWIWHLQRSRARLHDNGNIHLFLQKHFLHWLEALSLMRKTSDSILAVGMLRSMVLVSGSMRLYGYGY